MDYITIKNVNFYPHTSTMLSDISSLYANITDDSSQPSNNQKYFDLFLKEKKKLTK